MINFLGKMFGSDKAIEKTIDTVSSGLDKLYYSEEERAEDEAKNRSEARSMVIKWMASTQGQNVTRRFIAVSVTTTWLSGFILGKLFLIVNIWATDDKLIQTADAFKNMSVEMNAVMMLIIGFYFSAPYLDKFIPSKK